MCRDCGCIDQSPLLQTITHEWSLTALQKTLLGIFSTTSFIHIQFLWTYFRFFTCRDFTITAVQLYNTNGNECLFEQALCKLFSARQARIRKEEGNKHFFSFCRIFLRIFCDIIHFSKLFYFYGWRHTAVSFSLPPTCSAGKSKKISLLVKPLFFSV